MLDLRMFLVSLKSCIACLVVLSSSPSLLCSPANNRAIKKLGYMRISYKRTATVKWHITRLCTSISPKNRTKLGYMRISYKRTATVKWHITRLCISISPKNRTNRTAGVVNKLTGTESLMIKTYERQYDSNLKCVKRLIYSL